MYPQKCCIYPKKEPQLSAEDYVKWAMALGGTSGNNLYTKNVSHAEIYENVTANVRVRHLSRAQFHIRKNTLMC